MIAKRSAGNDAVAPTTARSALRGSYLVRNPLLLAWLGINDAVGGLLRPARANATASGVPRSVLVCVGGHRGDAVIATSLLVTLTRTIPDVELGVVTGSWNAEIFGSHPRVRHLHIVDAWQWNRSGGLSQRVIRNRSTRQRALSEISKISYDAALDLSPYYPNFARVLAAAAIPTRVGFTSGGFGYLYTHPVVWRDGRHVTEDHHALLAVLVSERALAAEVPPGYELGEADAAAAVAVARKLERAGAPPSGYVLVHPGAGNARKEWNLRDWITVVRAVRAEGVPVVLSGCGPREARTTAAIAASVEGAIDLCDTFTWKEFREAITRARMLLTVDTVAMHLAAAVDTPCISIMAAMDNIDRWRPSHGRVTALTRRVACAPCHRSRGCATMACVRGVRSDVVIATTLSELGATAAR